MATQRFSPVETMKLVEGSKSWPQRPPNAYDFYQLYAQGWIERDPFTGKLSITSKGKAHLKKEDLEKVS